MKQKQIKKQRAFTLIELLLVIAITGLISSIILASVYRARLKARDIRRAQDISQISTALSLYYSSNGHFPCHDSRGGNYDKSTNNNFLQPLIDSGFLASNPKDPTNSSAYHYDYSTFHTSSNAQCGQYAMLALYTELPPALCPTGGAWSVSDQHCHVMVGNILPDPCENPFFLDDLKTLPGNQGCTTWLDSVSAY